MKGEPNAYQDFQVKHEPQELGYDPGFPIAINASESHNMAGLHMVEHVQVKSEPAFLENDEPKFNSLASDTLHPELQSPGEERTTEYLSSSVFVECSTDEDVGNQLSSNSDINSTSGQMENTPNKNKKGNKCKVTGCNNRRKEYFHQSNVRSDSEVSEDEESTLKRKFSRTFHVLPLDPISLFYGSTILELEILKLLSMLKFVRSFHRRLY